MPEHRPAQQVPVRRPAQQVPERRPRGSGCFGHGALAGGRVASRRGSGLELVEQRAARGILAT
ncbi:hypothetical protein [Agromyces laixinhei]|uniref:hypothetical protein n=1 Tax=Agromyces laixinhei TaxID=2585717 RepID=UPI0012EDE8A6|nr:hypothetical protein [Agromyces laixinhei]